MWSRRVDLKRYKSLLTPLVVLLLVGLSWEYLIELTEMPLTSLLSIVVFGGLSLWANSLVIHRVTYRYRRSVSAVDSLWLTSVGVLGNSLGLPIGTGAKYYFWVVRAGLKVRQSLLGIGYFSLCSFLVSLVLALLVYTIASANGQAWLGLLSVSIVLFVLPQVLAGMLFEGRRADVIWDGGLSLLVVLLMAMLVFTPLSYYYSEISTTNILIISLGFIALSYVTFVASIPAGQELLLGTMTAFLGEQFMSGVAVSLVVRMAYVLSAAAVVMFVKPAVTKSA